MDVEFPGTKCHLQIIVLRTNVYYCPSVSSSFNFKNDFVKNRIDPIAFVLILTICQIFCVSVVPMWKQSNMGLLKNLLSDLKLISPIRMDFWFAWGLLLSDNEFYLCSLNIWFAESLSWPIMNVLPITRGYLYNLPTWLKTLKEQKKIASEILSGFCEELFDDRVTKSKGKNNYLKTKSKE